MLRGAYSTLQNNKTKSAKMKKEKEKKKKENPRVTHWLLQILHANIAR